MTERRVVITGMGSVTPIGIGNAAYAAALKKGTNGIGPITRVNSDHIGVHIAAEVENFNPEDYMGKITAKRTDRSTQYALAAAQEAILDAAFATEEKPKGGIELKLPGGTERIATILGTGIGGFETIVNQHKVLLDPEKGPKKLDPLTVPKLMPNSPAGWISIECRLKGKSQTINAACSSANDAMAVAYDNILLGRHDVVVTGGVEGVITDFTLAAFDKMKALSHTGSRPFDKERDGFVMGEGAGVLIFEDLEHARARDAQIYAEVVGYGSTSDAHHITAPDPEAHGAIRAMKDALIMAGMQPESVDYINAHGTSTSKNDSMETKAIKQVFEFHAENLLVTSTKSMIGHCLGAAGGLELVATLLGMERDLIYPTINYENPDPDCNLAYVPNNAISADVDVALSNSLGFGGHNCCVLVRRWDE